MTYKAKRNLTDGLVQVFTRRELRSPTTVYSDVADVRGYDKRTVLLVSDLDQAVTATVQGARNQSFDNPVNIGDGIAVAVTATVFAERAQYFPYLRIKAENAATATTGGLDGYFLLKV